MTAWMALNVVTLLLGFMLFPTMQEARYMQNYYSAHGVHRTLNEALAEVIVYYIGMMVVFYVCGLCVVALIKFLLPKKR